MTDIVQLLGKEAEDLLQHRCTTIPAENLYLPGDDFVDRVMIDNN
ncbi:fructose-bisphosphate aldolase, partial [Morganella morganii]